jgi:hypothetical protein
LDGKRGGEGGRSEKEEGEVREREEEAQVQEKGGGGGEVTDRKRKRKREIMAAGGQRGLDDVKITSLRYCWFVAK